MSARRVVMSIGCLLAAWGLAGVGAQTSPPPEVDAIASPSGFSGGESLITFEGESGPVSSVGGVSFRQNGLPVRLGLDCDARPFGPGDCSVVDNDQPFSGAPIEVELASPATRFAFEARFNGDG